MTKQAGDRRPWPLSRVDLRARTQPAPAPWDKTLQSWNPMVVVVLAILGAGGSVLLLLINADATTSSARFIESAGFPLWAAVIAAQTAVWAVITVPLLGHHLKAWTVISLAVLASGRSMSRPCRHRPVPSSPPGSATVTGWTR